jgi:hypothetical protein
MNEENVSLRWIPCHEKHGQDFVFAHGTHRQGGHATSLSFGRSEHIYPNHSTPPDAQTARAGERIRSQGAPRKTNGVETNGVASHYLLFRSGLSLVPGIPQRFFDDHCLLSLVIGANFTIFAVQGPSRTPSTSSTMADRNCKEMQIDDR